MNDCLSGLKVLDLSRILAGPFAGQFFADLGADVIKVEQPGRGDDQRQAGPPFLKDSKQRDTRESAPFVSVNRGKRSITVDLSTSQGQAIVRSLAAQSDVLIENYMVGTLAKFGLDYESIRAINSRIVYCSITGFGQSGPYNQRPGYDMIAQAMSGVMSITGESDGRPGGGPQRVGYASSDIAAGLYAIAAIQAALLHRELTGGDGQHIDLALLDAQVAVLSYVAQNYLLSGNVPGRVGNASGNAAPWGAFPCADGTFAIAVGNNDQFERLCLAMGCTQLPTDVRFATTPDRVRNREILAEVLSAIFRRRTVREWVAELDAARVPCGPINDIKQVFEDPQVRHRELVVSIPHPLAGTVRVVANPIKFSDTPVRYQRPPPLLGEHTREVLRERLGMDDGAIDGLAAARVI